METVELVKYRILRYEILILSHEEKKSYLRCKSFYFEIIQLDQNKYGAGNYLVSKHNNNFWPDMPH